MGRTDRAEIMGGDKKDREAEQGTTIVHRLCREERKYCWHFTGLSGILKKSQTQHKGDFFFVRAAIRAVPFRHQVPVSSAISGDTKLRMI